MGHVYIKFVKKLMTLSLFCSYDFIIIFCDSRNLKILTSPIFIGSNQNGIISLILVKYCLNRWLLRQQGNGYT